MFIICISSTNLVQHWKYVIVENMFHKSSGWLESWFVLLLGIRHINQNLERRQYSECINYTSAQTYKPFRWKWLITSEQLVLKDLFYINDQEPPGYEDSCWLVNEDEWTVFSTADQTSPARCISVHIEKYHSLHFSEACLLSHCIGEPFYHNFPC